MLGAGRRDIVVYDLANYDEIASAIRAANEEFGLDFIVRKIEEANDKDYGYNVLTGKFGSMTKAGILDPLKVTRFALQNAASVAMMVLTTETLVTDLPEEKKESAMPSPDMGGMGGMDY